MALINCPECNKDFSEYAKECPNCGCPIDIAKQKMISFVATEIKEDIDKDENKTVIKNKIIEIITLNNEPMLSSSIKRELYLIDKSYVDNMDNLIEELINEGIIEISFDGAVRYKIATGNKDISKFKTAPRMIKCPNCDNKIYETATTCSYCGLQDVKSALIEKERKMESTKPIDTLIKCPKCGSTQIQAVPRKWSLMTGFLTNKIDRVCLNCKNKF